MTSTAVAVASPWFVTVSVYVIESPFRTAPSGSLALAIVTSGSSGASFQQNERWLSP